LTLPYRGARREGVTGFATGVGKGFGGLVFKTSAGMSNPPLVPIKVLVLTTIAAFGLPGYTLKGLEKQFEKRYTRDLKAKLIAIRLRQGIAEFERVTPEEKEESIRRWKELCVDCGLA
jgi:hypothetical protein